MNVVSEMKHYIVEEILFGEDLSIEADTPLQEAGILDSTGFLEVLTHIEQHYGIDVQDQEIVPEHFGTLARMAAYIEKKRQQKAVA